jgi:acyl dehydratase
VTLHSFATSPDNRYFEDYAPEGVYEIGEIIVTEAEIIEFARQFDPQYFHTDPEKAVRSRFGGLIASGWHTASLVMRLYVDRYLSHVASLASPGVDELRWPNPVRPGDTLRVRVTVLEARPSRSKADRGVVRGKIEAFNQRDELVISMIGISIIGRRPQAAGA